MGFVSGEPRGFSVVVSGEPRGFSVVVSGEPRGFSVVELVKCGMSHIIACPHIYLIVPTLSGNRQVRIVDQIAFNNWDGYKRMTPTNSSCRLVIHTVYMSLVINND